MKKISEYKKELENEINDKLKEFVEDTGLSINYVDFSSSHETGFKHNETYNTKIILKND
jgi:3-oxoacyl-(acyl-carrier-protein) synthase